MSSACALSGVFVFLSGGILDFDILRFFFLIVRSIPDLSSQRVIANRDFVSRCENLVYANGNLYSYKPPLIFTIFVLWPRVYVIPIDYILVGNLPDFDL